MVSSRWRMPLVLATRLSTSKESAAAKHPRRSWFDAAIPQVESGRSRRMSFEIPTPVVGEDRSLAAPPPKRRRVAAVKRGTEIAHGDRSRSTKRSS
jgi:hypothetical protein